MAARLALVSDFHLLRLLSEASFPMTDMITNICVSVNVLHAKNYPSYWFEACPVVWRTFH